MSEKEIRHNERFSNDLFVRFLKENGYFTSDDVIVEFVRSMREALSVNPAFHGYSRFIFCNHLPSIDTIEEKAKESNGNRKYRINFISNSFNRLVQSFVDESIPRCDFNIGICTDNANEFKYGKLELVKFGLELEARGIEVNQEERELSKNNHLYLLTNRGRNNAKK